MDCHYIHLDNLGCSFILKQSGIKKSPVHEVVPLEEPDNDNPSMTRLRMKDYMF
jgi:hypothetical protein